MLLGKGTAIERVCAAPTEFPASWQNTLADALDWMVISGPQDYAIVFAELAEDWLKMRDKARASREILGDE